ncbi:hypothetical protein DPEC_G00086620 [Dallia pectoralis]|uniref:Uncharacterized protein n=1 Tax=Dallia pectoralis TaxID=75939 RepID=A0ACC2GZS4_DALPE|nr:hypothetical protein DPEC_G00086620 [Dallia pectoralis]
MIKSWSKECYVNPLVSDFEELLGRFQQTESVRFEEFSAIWKNMGFGRLFYGFLTGFEMREFCQLTLTTTFNYFLPPYSFQIRVGALYLLYGLYYTQLALPKAKIRIALKDWKQIQKFYQDCANSQHYDAVYILKKLISEKAVVYAAMPKPLNFRVGKKDNQHKVCEEFRDRPQRVKELLYTDVLEVANIQSHYERLKASVLANSSITVIQPDLAGRLHGCMLEFLHWQDRHGDCGDTEPLVASDKKAQQIESFNRAQLLEAIKTKSYGHVTEASKSRRHRQVEMDMYVSGTKQIPEVTKWKKKGPSLKARTCKIFGEDGYDQKRQHWLLSPAEEESGKLKRPK